MFLSYKSISFHTLLFIEFSLGLDFEFFYEEIIKLMDRFIKNGYPSNVTDIFIKMVLDRISIDKTGFELAQLIYALPFMVKNPLQIR